MRYTASLADLQNAGLRVWWGDGVLRWSLGCLSGICAEDQVLADVVASELAVYDVQLSSVRVSVPPLIVEGAPVYSPVWWARERAERSEHYKRRWSSAEVSEEIGQVDAVLPQQSACSLAGATIDTPPDDLGLPFDDSSDLGSDDLSDAEVCEERAEDARQSARLALDAAQRAEAALNQVLQGVDGGLFGFEGDLEGVPRTVGDLVGCVFDVFNAAEGAAGRCADYQRAALDAVTRAQVAAGDAQQAAERAELADSSAFTEHRAARSAAQRAGEFAADAEIQRVLVEQAGRALRWPVLACWLAVPVAALTAWLAGRRRVS
ncbi:MAG TPA: hypothetical protein VFS21_40245 [Roseiflexaceae bacterium]|nr:hypothetical protein [Roseiflexaceae bacterium]